MASREGPQHGSDSSNEQVRYYFKKLKVPLEGVERFKAMLVTGSLGVFAKWIINVINTTHYYDAHHATEAMYNREAGVGLITVSNHVSAVDDPGLPAALTSWRTTALEPERVRWTMCATDRCYKHPITGPLLSYGKTIPIQRGKGLWQAFMDDAVDLLNEGEWLHVFPEGRRTRDGSMLPLRPGVGRLIADSRTQPLVVPIYHRGMEQIMGVGGYNPVQPGNHVSIRCGPPMHFHDLMEVHRPDGIRGSDESEKELYKAITARIEQELHRLEALAVHDIPLDSSSGRAPEADQQRLGGWAPASYAKAAAKAAPAAPEHANNAR